MGCSVRVGISTGIIYLLTPACVGTPAGIDRMQGLVTPSVTELVAPLLAVWSVEAFTFNGNSLASCGC